MVRERAEGDHREVTGWAAHLGCCCVQVGHGGGNARTTVRQTRRLRWVRKESPYDVYTRLQDLGLADAGVDEITDVVSCPGTDSCKMGITSSMGLNRAVQERIEGMAIEDELTKRIHIKMSGCPNGCSQHHIANIGFYGASLKVGGRTMPAYVPHLGGKYVDGEVIFGKRLKSRLPSRRVPDAVERWIKLYESDREDGEIFNDFVDRVGTATMEAEVKDLTLPADGADRVALEQHRRPLEVRPAQPIDEVVGGQDDERLVHGLVSTPCGCSAGS